MVIRLFLRHITQENFRHQVDWSGNVWAVQCCVLGGFGKFPRGDDPFPVRNSGVFLRAEPGGGLVWDSRSNAVYKVDDEAYHALLELERGVSEDEVAKRIGVPITSVQTLIAKINALRKPSKARRAKK